MPFQFFERDEDFEVIDRRLPHWTQPGTLAFITFRTCDSMPADVVKAWQNDRSDWLRAHQINPQATGWRPQLEHLDARSRREFQQRFVSRWHDHLDDCHGACVLRSAELSQIVADSLLHFDGDRYWISDFVVMPNHVHLLGAFVSEDGMLKQCESWKRFIATQINRVLGKTGRFWQQDAFDHLVRSEPQYQHYRNYIASNPSKAKLKAGEYRRYAM